MKLFRLLFFIFNFALSFSAGSQSHPYEVKFSHEIEAGVANGNIRPSKAGLLYSLIGEYYISNTYSDIPVSWGVDTIDCSKYNVASALPRIIDEAKNHQIVIISENHLKPQHRIFAKQIIKALSKHGFNHLGMEAFANVANANELLDKELADRGYPFNFPLTGTYTLEPRMGQLVRTAIQHDYQLFAYERTKIKGKDRDEIQADNIARYIAKHPEGKFIILCGFHHAIESDRLKYGKHKWMASALKEKTGIDPLTIYQDNFTEKFSENSHHFLHKKTIEKPSVFVDHDDSLIAISEEVDMEIIHPKTDYINGRPNWLYEDETYQSIQIENLDSLAYPIIAAAHRKGEHNSVPIDRIELKYKYDNKTLVLPPGIYSIEMKDRKHSIEYEIEVK